MVLEDPVALALRAGEGPQLDDLAFGPLAVAPIMQEVKPIKIVWSWCCKQSTHPAESGSGVGVATRA